jgi:hypothetical protein
VVAADLSPMHPDLHAWPHPPPHLAQPQPPPGAASAFSWRGADLVVMRRDGLLLDPSVVVCGSGDGVNTHYKVFPLLQQIP